MLSSSSLYGISKIVGLDIDSKLKWEINDSLNNIPHIDNAIIITNPPYLTNYSARRKKIINGLENYFKNYTDLYQLAILKMLEAEEYVVAIVPETFINSNFITKVKQRIKSITILLENPFDDTENPVCVVCFDNNFLNNRDIEVYIGNKYINTLDFIKSKNLNPTNKYNIVFNDSKEKLGLRAVDMPNVDKKIEFMKVSNLKYNINNIKESSRLITVINISYNVNMDELVNKCNFILLNYRHETMDISLSPFKGNAKDGTRRRRLDYKTARAIIEKSLDELLEGKC